MSDYRASPPFRFRALQSRNSFHARIYVRDETNDDLVEWLEYAAKASISRSTVLPTLQGSSHLGPENSYPAA